MISPSVMLTSARKFFRVFLFCPASGSFIIYCSVVFKEVLIFRLIHFQHIAIVFNESK